MLMLNRETFAHWDKMSDKAAKNFLRPGGMGGRVQHENHPSRIFIREYIGDLVEAHMLTGSTEPFRVCEVGCATGYEFENIQEYFDNRFKGQVPWDYKGFDVTTRLLEQAKRNSPDEAHRFIWGDSDERLGAGNDTFDLVFCRHLFEHLPHYEKTLREMMRIVKNHLIVTFFIPPKDIPYDHFATFRAPEGRYWNTQYSKPQLENLLRYRPVTFSWADHGKDVSLVLQKRQNKFTTGE